MEEKSLEKLMETTMQNIKSMLDTNTVVGEPIYTPDGITLIPLSRVSIGFGGGGAEFAKKEGYGGGTGYAVKVDPTGFLVIENGKMRMFNVIPPANNTLDRIIDMTPTMMDRVDQLIDKITDNKKD